MANTRFGALTSTRHPSWCDAPRHSSSFINRLKLQGSSQVFLRAWTRRKRKQVGQDVLPISKRSPFTGRTSMHIQNPLLPGLSLHVGQGVRACARAMSSFLPMSRLGQDEYPCIQHVPLPKQSIVLNNRTHMSRTVVYVQRSPTCTRRLYGSHGSGKRLQGSVGG